MLTLEHDRLVVRFPEVHADAQCTIEFQRTLRIPDDNRVHGLPPGLGTFPLFHVDDYAGKLPAHWAGHGGVFLPMYQAEAMWIRFSSRYPFAVKIATGKINAVSGEAWTPRLQRAEHVVGPAHDQLARTPQDQAAYLQSIASMPPARVAAAQDYVTIPDQPWLDGFNVGNGQIRQFVAMPLGDGYTVEEQITGEAVHGGLQLIVYPLHPLYYTPPRALTRGFPGGYHWNGYPGDFVMASASYACANSLSLNASAESAQMGLAPGGLMKQEVFTDRHGIEKWDQNHSAKCFVHLLNSQQFERVTGRRPPTKAPTAESYTRAGLPWYDYYAESAHAVPGSDKLRKLDSVAALGNKKGEQPLPENAPVGAVNTVMLKKKVPNEVRDGWF
ncbi:hypothetical protein [Paraburkholderia sp. A3RO-2L]|uniref:hypothetical protein n=1 Tax=unclassified Paraburkholderia TaxID=2615204 RepID=UPI0032FF978C|nr:hypothetical protein [Burkholderia vietnamiensis]